MKISGHETRSVFDRYNITSEEDLKEVANRLDAYLQQKMVTFPVTLEKASGQHDSDPDTQPIENWRRGWGSNVRSRCQDSSFRDQSESGWEEDQSPGTAVERCEGSVK